MASPFADYKVEMISALAAIVVLVAFWVGRVSNKPSHEEINESTLTVRSNTAAEYFRVGVVIGATVERAKPGLPPPNLLAASLTYYASLGPDPLITVPPSEAALNLSKAGIALSKLKAQKTNGVETTNAP